jgi:hypothetical protein
MTTFSIHKTPEPPFDLTVMSLVAMGPEYARLLSLGKKGSWSVFHITPLGHSVLGERLRAHARGES